MKPFDLRLLRTARSVRGLLLAGGALGIARTAAVIAWSWLLANLLATLVLPVLGGLGGAAGRVADGSLPAAAVPGLLAAAVAALLVRAAASWGMEALAARGAVRVKSQLRRAALDAVDARSPEWFATRPDARFATVLGRGLDALDGYFSTYLPQLLLAVLATPLLVLAVLLADPVSGITVLIVFPVIPVFMVLIGLATRVVQDRQWAQLDRLSRAFLDVIEGLATLRIFRREDRQRTRIATETGEYRSRTMQVLRVTFLSGFVLDLAGTFSIALVAVTVGTRLVAGEFPLALGLFVLLLLPETFIPIRQVGAAFHQSAEGLVAAGAVFAIIDGDGDDTGNGDAVRPGTVPDPASRTAATTTDAAAVLASDRGVRVVGASVRRGGRTVAGPLDLEVRPGEVVAFTGPSGAGKSSLLSALLGFSDLAAGTVSRPDRVAWVGQRPGLLQGTIAENVALGAERVEDALVRRALDAVGLDLDPSRELGSQGSGVSGGQAQRIAIARGLYRAWTTDASVLLLDEPSSALDAENEARVAAALRAEAAAGRAVLVVTHRPALIAAADREISIGVPA